MTPLAPIEHEEVAALIGLAKWVSGIGAAVWVATKFLLKTGIQAGEEKRKYAELMEDVESLKKQQGGFITKPEHESLSKICTVELESLIDTKIQASIRDLRQEMSTMNGNICKILGAMNIEPVDPGRRRRSDVPEPRS